MTFVIILMTVFLAGIVNIWLWANNQIVTRQKAYNASRVAAGTSVDTYTLQWPPDYSLGQGAARFVPEGLKEDRVIVDAPRMGGRQ